MVGGAWLLIQLPLETRQVAPENIVVLTLKSGEQTFKCLTQLIVEVSGKNLVQRCICYLLFLLFNYYLMK